MSSVTCAQNSAFHTAILEALRHLETAIGPPQTARYVDAVTDAITVLYPYREELGYDTRRLVADTIRAMTLLSPLCERKLWFMVMVYDPYVVPLTARLTALATS